jgi:hypothetical protein
MMTASRWVLLSGVTVVVRIAAALSFEGRAAQM